MGRSIIKTGTILHKESAGTIISSIATAESAIAHILIAESEKLQAVINNPVAIADELVAINRSVKNAVDTIMMLKAKPEVFQSTIYQIG